MELISYCEQFIFHVALIDGIKSILKLLFTPKIKDGKAGKRFENFPFCPKSKYSYGNHFGEGLKASAQFLPTYVIFIKGNQWPAAPLSDFIPSNSL